MQMLIILKFYWRVQMSTPPIGATPLNYDTAAKQAAAFSTSEWDAHLVTITDLNKTVPVTAEFFIAGDGVTAIKLGVYSLFFNNIFVDTRLG